MAPAALARWVLLLSLLLWSATTQSASGSAAGNGSDAGGTVLNSLLQRGILRLNTSRADSDSLVTLLLINGTLRFGSAKQTDGNVFGLNLDEPRQCIKPNYLLACTVARNQAWVVNEWLTWNLWMAGVNHMVVYDDHSTDNLAAVLEPWKRAGLVTVQDARRDPKSGVLSQYLSFRHCFETFGQKYTWYTNIDVDEWLFPLETPCLTEALVPYEQYGGLSVGVSDATGRHLVARRDHTMAFEATRFTLGKPITRIKPLCVVKHTKHPAVNMPHCCVYLDGYTNVDENFVHDPDVPCWRLPNRTWFQPRKHIQILHFQAVSFEEVIHRKLTRARSNIGWPGRLQSLTTEFLAFKSNHQAVGAGQVSASAPVIARMLAFRDTLNAVLVGRWAREQAYQHRRQAANA